MTTKQKITLISSVVLILIVGGIFGVLKLKNNANSGIKNKKTEQSLFINTKSTDLSSEKAIRTMADIGANNESIGLPDGVRSRVVDLNPKVLSDTNITTGDAIQLNLFDDANYTARIDKVTKDGDGTVTMRGRLDDNPLGYAMITNTGNKSLIDIQVPEKNQSFIVQADNSGQNYLIDRSGIKGDSLEDKPSLLPQEDNTIPLSSSNELSLNDPSDPVTIDVMIAYTAAARVWADASGGGIANVIAQAIAKGQLTNDNSNTGVTIRLVHTVETPYVESGSSSTDLYRLTDTGDGYMDEIPTLRDQYGADLITLFTKVEDTGGISWLLNNSGGSPDYAFNISRVQQAGWTYTTIHEQGHNMGLGHHKAQNVQPGPGLFSYSAGWRWTGNDNGQYCDVMTYEAGNYFTDGIAHTRVGYFSNPSLTYQGVATGDAVNGDNARDIREIKSVIAAYRSNDNTPPAVSIGVPSSAVTTSGPVTYTITYSGADTVTLGQGDITLNQTGTSSGTVSVTGSGNTTRTVTLSNIFGNGTLGISIVAGTASDIAGNYAVATGSSTIFVIDNIPPTVNIGAPSASAASTGPTTYTVTYTGANNITLASNNVTLNRTGTANGTVLISGSGSASRTVTISSIVGDGTLGISIVAGTASDSAGNIVSAVGPSTTFTVDNTAPVVLINSPADGTVTMDNSIIVSYTVDGAPKTWAFSNFHSGANRLDVSESDSLFTTIASVTIIYTQPLNLSPTSFASGWNMISFADLSASITDKTLLPGTFLIRRFDGGSNSYVKGENSDISLNPGAGYWIKVDDANNVDGRRYVMNQVSASEIGVTKGWNLLGNPFQSEMPLSNLTVKYLDGSVRSYADAISRKEVSGYAWSWEASSKQYLFIAINPEKYKTSATKQYVVNPFRGFWMIVKSDQVSSIIMNR